MIVPPGSVASTWQPCVHGSPLALPPAGRSTVDFHAAARRSAALCSEIAPGKSVEDFPRDLWLSIARSEQRQGGQCRDAVLTLHRLYWDALRETPAFFVVSHPGPARQSAKGRALLVPGLSPLAMQESEIQLAQSCRVAAQQG